MPLCVPETEGVTGALGEILADREGDCVEVSVFEAVEVEVRVIELEGVCEDVPEIVKVGVAVCVVVCDLVPELLGDNV